MMRMVSEVSGLIKQNVPPSCGVYLLYSGSRCVYVGASTNLRRRLQNHPLRGRFDRFQIYRCTPNRAATIEHKLISRIDPPLNKKAWGYSPFVFVGVAKRSALKKPA